MKDTSLCLSVCVSQWLGICSIMIMQMLQALQRSFLAVMLTMTGVIQGETKQFSAPFSLSLYTLHRISMLLGHHDLGCTAAGTLI